MIRREITPLMQDLMERQGLISGGFLCLALVYTLYFAKALMMPIFLALLLTLALRPVVRLLYKLYVPEAIGAALVVLALLLLAGWVVLAVSGPASTWIDRAPLLKLQLHTKLEALRGPLEQVREVTKNLEEAASLGKDAQPSVVVEGPSMLERIFVEAQTTLINFMVMIVLVFFLLARGGWTYRRVVAAIEDDGKREMWTTGLEDVRSNLARYLLTISIINGGLGLCTGLAMWLLGMPNPLLWGVLAAIMNYIPYAGALVMLSIIAIVAILSFDQWTTIAMPPLAFGMLTFLEGQIISPFVVGHRLTLDPIAVFLSVLFWGWLWGFAGMLLAVPILAALKITMSVIKSPAPMAALIDSEGDEELAEEELAET